MGKIRVSVCCQVERHSLEGHQEGVGCGNFDGRPAGRDTHTLKHTAITWALQNGASVWDCAGYFGSSAETIERTYGHHSPDFQSSAVEAMER